MDAGPDRGVAPPPSPSAVDRLAEAMSRRGLTEARTNLLVAGAYGYLAVQALRNVTAARQPIAFVYLALHVSLAVLFLVRHRTLVRSDRPVGYVAAVAATFGIYLLDYSEARTGRLRSAGEWLILVGAILVLLSALSLGRSYGITPAHRGLQTGRMYALVRHPLYASYLVLHLGYLLTFPGERNLAVLLSIAGLLVLRAAEEERVLRTDPAYGEYARRVRYRLVPFVY